jgi:hypothetical protein
MRSTPLRSPARNGTRIFSAPRIVVRIHVLATVGPLNEEIPLIGQVSHASRKNMDWGDDLEPFPRCKAGNVQRLLIFRLCNDRAEAAPMLVLVQLLETKR